MKRITGLVGIPSALCLAGFATTAIATCPPDCPPVTIGEETIWTLGGIDHRVLITTQVPDSIFSTGGDGSLSIGLAGPFSITDPGWKHPSVVGFYTFDPSDRWVKARIAVDFPTDHIDRSHIGDPKEPTVRIFPPIPVGYEFLPRPFLGIPIRGRIDWGLELSCGAIFSPIGQSTPTLADDGCPGGNFDTATFTYHITPLGAPEPGIWMMLVLGFGAVGASLRGARRALT